MLNILARQRAPSQIVGTHRSAGEGLLAGPADGVEALDWDRRQNGDELPIGLVTTAEPAADLRERGRQRPVPERCTVPEHAWLAHQDRKVVPLPRLLAWAPLEAEPPPAGSAGSNAV